MIHRRKHALPFLQLQLMDCEYFPTLCSSLRLHYQQYLLVWHSQPMYMHSGWLSHSISNELVNMVSLHHCFNIEFTVSHCNTCNKTLGYVRVSVFLRMSLWLCSSKMYSCYTYVWHINTSFIQAKSFTCKYFTCIRIHVCWFANIFICQLFQLAHSQ